MRGDWELCNRNEAEVQSRELGWLQCWADRGETQERGLAEEEHKKLRGKLRLGSEPDKGCTRRSPINPLMSSDIKDQAGVIHLESQRHASVLELTAKLWKVISRCELPISAARPSDTQTGSSRYIAAICIGTSVASRMTTKGQKMPKCKG
ncbi:hypothetical protein ILYODFUR_017808 [Ilyodon furcidens]|uniref:Uncharacterized protein n=1 Tax=Ilyodon furcidens TaxID=33524 RepID=A0ABV0TVK8_9TELE